MMAASGAVFAATGVIARYELRGKIESAPASASAPLTARQAAGGKVLRTDLGVESSRADGRGLDEPARAGPASEGASGSERGSSSLQGPAQAEKLRGKLAEV